MQCPAPAAFSVLMMLSCLEALPPGLRSPEDSGCADRNLFTQHATNQKLTAIHYPHSTWNHRGMNTVFQATGGFITLALQFVDQLS